MQSPVPSEATITRQVILIPDDAGGYTVEVPSLPGCFSEGDTLDEAIANIQEAIALWIEDALDHGEDVPLDLLTPIQVITVPA